MRYLLVEGITDIEFVKYICVKKGITPKYNSFKKQSKDHANYIVYEYEELKLIDIKGQTNLESVLTSAIMEDPTIIKNIKYIGILQDADNDYTKSLESINDVINKKMFKTIKSKCEIFLTSNDKDIGDLETLLLSSLDKDNAQIKCFESYEKCLNKNAPANLQTKYMNKAKVYAYTMYSKDGKNTYTPHQSFMYKKNKKYIDTGLWDITNDKFDDIVKYINMVLHD